MNADPGRSGVLPFSRGACAGPCAGGGQTVLKAAHVICRRKGRLLENLTPIAPVRGIYRSGFWSFSVAQAETLGAGGWLYLHAQASEPSDFGGQVLRWRKVLHRGAERIEFEILFKPSARGQPWRGRPTTVG